MKKILIIFFCFLLNSCATTNSPPIITQQSNIIHENSLKIAKLTVEIKDLKKKVKEIEKELEKINEKLIYSKKISDNKTKELILSKISELSAKQEDYLTFLSKINEELSLIKKELIEKKIKNSKLKPKTKTTIKTKRKLKSEDQKFYEKCFALYKKRLYQKCVNCFEDFIKKFKKSPLLPNAYFWIGNSYFQQGKFLQAIDNYDIVLTNYSKSKKVPAALLKEGLAFYYMKDKEGAKIFLQKVINEYPTTPQAYYAKKFLEKFNLK